MLQHNLNKIEISGDRRGTGRPQWIRDGQAIGQLGLFRWLSLFFDWRSCVIDECNHIVEAWLVCYFVSAKWQCWHCCEFWDNIRLINLYPIFSVITSSRGSRVIGFCSLIEEALWQPSFLHAPFLLINDRQEHVWSLFWSAWKQERHLSQNLDLARQCVPFHSSSNSFRVRLGPHKISLTLVHHDRL